MTARVHIPCGATYTRAQYDALGGRIVWEEIDGLVQRQCRCRSHITWEGLALLCARCGATLPDGARVCPRCELSAVAS